jgi:hypothetical protein
MADGIIDVADKLAQPLLCCQEDCLCCDKIVAQFERGIRLAIETAFEVTDCEAPFDVIAAEMLRRLEVKS